MKNLIKFGLPLAMSLIGLSAHANAITGTVRMAGQVTFDTQSLATATAASFTNPAAIVTSGTGSYAGVPTGVSSPGVNFNNFSFASTGPNVVPSLWSFVYNGWTYSFSLADITSVTRTDSTDLSIKGDGAVNIAGAGSPYTVTSASWSFDVTDTSGGNSGSFVFGFSQSDTAVPDGGNAAILLGVAIAGLIAFGKFRKATA
ncbi:MAG TPA: hypothetical protein VFB72_00040 [Verrucomicrobiae bacterium]|nr:hypothetical protein [Verrucomicrobiae bacterium]